jgi:hypothetical protein
VASGADIVVTGRVADPSLFVAPLMHEYGWAPDDIDRLARGTAVGHLLECAGQLCGGYFADPGRKDIPDMARIGFPFADVDADVIVCGHTHTQFERTIAGKRVINSGSVGSPYEDEPGAYWTLDLEHRRTEYDSPPVAQLGRDEAIELFTERGL